MKKGEICEGGIEKGDIPNEGNGFVEEQRGLIKSGIP